MRTPHLYYTTETEKIDPHLIVVILESVGLAVAGDGGVLADGTAAIVVGDFTAEKESG